MKFDWNEFMMEEFTEKDMELLTDNGQMAMFLKIQFLEGAKRKEFFEKYPPKYIYMFLEIEWLLGIMEMK